MAKIVAEVLSAQCQRVTWNGSHVAHAECFDAYSGAEVITDTAPSALQVDHVLPSAEAWKRRAWHNADGTTCEDAKHCAEFVRFFNDTSNLIVTRARTNIRKSDRMPSEWCPANGGAFPLIARIVRQTASRWSIPLTAQDRAGLAAWDRRQCYHGAKVVP
jgi:hypothetical protein